MKITINSVYSREHFAAVDHIIKHYKKFNSLTEYFTYILDILCKYEDTNDFGKLALIKVINPVHNTNSSDNTNRKIMFKYKITGVTHGNKTKFEYSLTITEHADTMIANLEGGSFWNIDRLFDYLMYQLLRNNSETFTLPFSQGDLATIAHVNIYRKFDALRQK